MKRCGENGQGRSAICFSGVRMRKEKGLSKLDLTVSDTDNDHSSGTGCFIYLNITCLCTGHLENIDYYFSVIISVCFYI